MPIYLSMRTSVSKIVTMCVCRFDKMEIHVGCCIESRNDAEMPESIMGSVTMHKPNINFAYDWEESVKHKELVRESL